MVLLISLTISLGECVGEWTGAFGRAPTAFHRLLAGTIVLSFVALFVFGFLENRRRKALLREYRRVNRERASDEAGLEFLRECFIDRPFGFLFRIGVGYRSWDEEESRHNSRVLNDLADLTDGAVSDRLRSFSKRFGEAARHKKDCFRLPYDEHRELHELVYRPDSWTRATRAGNTAQS